MRRPFRIPLVLLALACAPAPAATQSVDELGLVTGGDGRDVVAFSNGRLNAVLAAERPDGSFAAVQQLWPSTSGADSATYALRGGDEVVGGWEAFTPEDSRGGGRESLSGALFAGRHGTALGSARRLFSGQPDGLRLAANRRGDVAALIGGSGDPPRRCTCVRTAATTTPARRRSPAGRWP